MSEERQARKTSKVQRVIEEYELTDIGDTLESYWIGETDEQYSLRQLADLFNQEVLRAALTRAGVSTLEGEVENVYRLLTSDTVSSGSRIEMENKLDRNGIDTEQLRRDFVSHQTIYTYLTEIRGVSYESETGEGKDQIEKGAETVRRLQNRTVAVAETTLENLRNTDRIALEDFDVVVDLRVICENCGRSYAVDELLRNEGCDCSVTAD